MLTSAATAHEIDELAASSASLRTAIIELHARAGGGHLGSSLSAVEILTVLFERFFRWDNTGSRWEGDRFVLSKGHAALGLYCLFEQHGRLPRGRLETFGQNGSLLEPHPNERLDPNIHASTGSLGQGLSIGVGLALGSRLQGRADRTFVLIGDGEANEGQIWEAARSAAALGLSNLIAILDDNGLQQDGETDEILSVRDLPASWRHIGWCTVNVDGHNCNELRAGLSALIESGSGQPGLLHARTIKGKGIPFLEGRTESHYPPPLSLEERALIRYERKAERNHD